MTLKSLFFGIFALEIKSINDMQVRKTITLLTLFICIVCQCYAQATEGDAPKLTYVFEIQAVCDPAFTVGETPKGKRIVIPITGGKIVGKDINGIVVPGGADYQLADEKHNRTDLEAIYCVRTDDGVSIHVRNRGIISNTDGKFYFRCSPTFEAPYDSRYAWLNDAIFVCVPGFGDGYISLKMYKVE